MENIARAVKGWAGVAGVGAGVKHIVAAKGEGAVSAELVGDIHIKCGLGAEPLVLSGIAGVAHIEHFAEIIDASGERPVFVRVGVATRPFSWGK